MDSRSCSVIRETYMALLEFEGTGVDAELYAKFESFPNSELSESDLL